jgi:endonuclease/exonuclease/phosphatase family metal-dependent hydrolase
MPLSPTDQLHLNAAAGLLQIGEPLNAWNELERITPLNRAKTEVLTVRLDVCRKLKDYEQREESARRLLAHIEEMENKAFKGRIAGVIVDGDFNTNHDGQVDDDTIEMLTEAGFVNTWEGVPRKKRETCMGSGRFEPTTFDYIMTKGWKSAKAELVDIPEEASDHRPVALEIKL